MRRGAHTRSAERIDLVLQAIRARVLALRVDDDELVAALQAERQSNATRNEEKERAASSEILSHSHNFWRGESSPTTKLRDLAFAVL